MTADVLRWGILGTARIARERFIPGVRAGALGRVVAVGSRDPARAGAFAEELRIPRAHGSYDALLADPDVDAVYVALPNSLHVAWVMRAAEAGKHVLCEKPLARRAAEAERAAEACRRAGVLLMEGFMWRHHPQHARVRQLLEQGAIGEPRFLRGSFDYVIKPVLPAGRNVRLAADLEGGSLMDVGCYPVNAARWIFGAEPSEVVAEQIVSAELGVEVDFAAVLRFPGDRLALVDSSFGLGFTNRYEIAGTRGRVLVEDAFRPDEQPGRIVVTTDERRVEETPPANQYARQADHFARSVRAGRLLPPAEDGVAQARVIEALLASAEQGAAVRLT